MAKIHVAGDGHTPPAAPFVFKPFSDKKDIEVVKRALGILETNVKGMKSCNDCFAKMPLKRTFADILADPAVVIHLIDDNTGNLYGYTMPIGGKDVAVTSWVVKMGRWLVASTLVHEFAHVNGASAVSTEPEAALPPCGFGFKGHWLPGHAG